MVASRGPGKNLVAARARRVDIHVHRNGDVLPPKLKNNPPAAIPWFGHGAHECPPVGAMSGSGMVDMNVHPTTLTRGFGSGWLHNEQKLFSAKDAKDAKKNMNVYS